MLRVHVEEWNLAVSAMSGLASSGRNNRSGWLPRIDGAEVMIRRCFLGRCFLGR